MVREVVLRRSHREDLPGEEPAKGKRRLMNSRADVVLRHMAFNGFYDIPQITDGRNLWNESMNISSKLLEQGHIITYVY